VSEILAAFAVALGLIVDLDAGLLRIVALSLWISLSATAVAGVIGLPLGALLAITPFRGRGTVIMVLNGLLGLPPVVVGLLVYLLLSRSGPLGALGLLFTPGAMIVAQSLLETPILIVLSYRALIEPWQRYGDALFVDGASRLRAVAETAAMGRAGLLTAFLAGFGRAISEVGAIIIVGGNIAGVTRTMTTAIMLETSRGNLPLALGLGLILVAISVGVSALAFASMRPRMPP
jgi:tungstate transport system permease protein